MPRSCRSCPVAPTTCWSPTRTSFKTASAPDPDDPYADSDPSPTVALRRRRSTTPRSRSRRTSRRCSWCCRSVVLAFLAAVMGVLDLPFKGADFLTIWLEPVVPRRRCAGAVVVRAGHHARDRRGAVRDRSASPSRTCSTGAGLARPGPRPARGASSGPSPPVLGNAYYYDKGISRLVDGPLRGVRQLPRPRRRHQDHRRRGQRRRLARQARRRFAAPSPGRPGAALRARHRARHRRNPALPRAVGGAVAVDFPILSAIIAVPIIGAIICLFTPSSRPEVAKAVGYATSMITFGLAACLLWNFAPHDPGFQFVEQRALDPGARDPLHRRCRRHQYLHDRGHRARCSRSGCSRRRSTSRTA